MRISTNQIYRQGLDGILKSQERLVKANTQLSSQTKILTPSDDPAASAQVLRLTERIQLNEQYRTNGILLKNTLTSRENILNNVQDTVERVRVLSLQSGNGSFSFEDRQSIAGELTATLSELEDLLNTRDESGEFIFSGFQADQKPFIFNGGTNSYDYFGDEGEREIQISESVRLTAGASGKEIFEDVSTRLSTTPAVIAAGVLTAATVSVDDQSQFDNFHRANYDPVTAANNNYSVQTAVGAPNTYQILNNGAPLAPPVTGNYVSGNNINFNGLDINISGPPAAGRVDFSLSPPSKENLLTGLKSFVDTLNNPAATSNDRGVALADILTTIDNSASNVAIERSLTGGRVNVLDSITDSLLDFDIEDQAARAELSEVNTAETFTQITQEETTLQALQASYTRITRLSLFDSL